MNITITGAFSVPLFFTFQPMDNQTLPKAGQQILSLPGVESLEKESDGWCCHLHYGWTTDALGGGGTIIDPNLRTIRSFVVNAYRIEP